MHYGAHRLAAYGMEIEPGVQRLVDLSDNGDVVSAYDVQTKHHLLDTLLHGEYALVRLVQYNVDRLVEALQGTHKVPTIRGDNRHGGVDVRFQAGGHGWLEGYS